MSECFCSPSNVATPRRLIIPHNSKKHAIELPTSTLFATIHDYQKYSNGAIIFKIEHWRLVGRCNQDGKVHD
jgi:hypothetical protein